MKDGPRFYTYIYLNPLKPGKFVYGDFSFDYEPFYIGKGQGNRIFKHLEIAIKKFKPSRNKKLNIIRKILRNGFSENDMKEKYIIKLQDKLLNFCAIGLEIYLIKSIGRSDLNSGPLANLTDGGEGNLGWNPSKETREKFSIRAKGKKYKERYGEEKAKQIGQKMSLTRKGRKNKLKGTNLESRLGKEKADKLKKDQSERMTGENHHNFGKHPEKFECPWCYTFCCKTNLKKWHNDNCLKKPGNENKKRGFRRVICEFCGKDVGINIYSQFHKNGKCCK
jgi:hypothetical protein